MQELLSIVGGQARTTSPLEAMAVTLAIAYLLLAIRQNIWCWLCAGIYTAIYVYLFIDAKLYMESVLNLFYFAMAIYGWHTWYFGRTEAGELPVVVWSPVVHAAAVGVVLCISAANGYLLALYTDAAFPYVDSLTTWSAIWATFLVARKVFENWYYWLVIDAVSIVIYWLRDLQLTSILYVVFVAMVPFGIVAWRRSLRQQQA